MSSSPCWAPSPATSSLSTSAPRRSAPALDQGGKVIWLLAFTAAGLALGYVLGVVISRLVRRGLDHVDEIMVHATGAEVVVGIGGVVVGLFIATLISFALLRIPIVGPYLTVPIYLLAGYFTAYLAAKKHVEILRLLGVHGAFEVVPGLTPAKLLDSSAIIDGRILEIVDTGFVEGELLVPRFVVEELQRLADSADAEKRVRGRRGLDFVKRLQNSSGAVRIDGADYVDIEAVDAKLVRLAKDTGAQIISTDYTLKKVAEIQGVKLLNVNDLANSVKPAVLPGEVIEVKILREGREHDQGVGYLDDGTMIVVEAGSALVGSRVKAEVTSVLQSPSGKMIFSRVTAMPPAGTDREGMDVEDQQTEETWVIVAAAGESLRMGLPDGESKQFLLLGGEPILSHSVRRLLAMSTVDGIVVVLHPSHTVRFANELVAFDDTKPLLIAEGGRMRSDSVRAGLLEVPESASVIAVHDGARPLFSRHVFEACLGALGRADGAVPAVEVSDTLKRGGEDRAVLGTVDRAGLWSAQTPQVFRAAVLRDVYARTDLNGATDDAMLLERAGYKVELVTSTPANVKITTPADIPLAGALLSWEVETDV